MHNIIVTNKGKDENNTFFQNFGYSALGQIDTAYGKIRSVELFMYAVSRKGFNTRWLNVKYVPYKEIKKLDSIKLPNYKAVLAYIICQMVLSRNPKELKDELIKAGVKVGDEIIVKEIIPVTKKFMNKDITVNDNNNKLTLYCKTLKEVFLMVLEDKFTEDNILTFVESKMENKDIDLFSGVELAV